MIRRDGFVNGFSLAFGAATLALFLWLGWRLLGAFAEIIAPFVVGVILALVLNPVVAKVQTRYTRGKRGPAVGIVFGLFLATFIGLVAWLVPAVIAQTGRLIHFFAPLSYKIEQRVPRSAPKVLEDGYGSNNYLVRNLQNGTRYTFRVTATDADGREYRLKTVTVVPGTSAPQVVQTRETVTTTNRTRSQTPRPNSTPTPKSTPTPRPAPTATPKSATPEAEATPSPRPTIVARAATPLPRPSVLPPLVSPSPEAGIAGEPRTATNAEGTTTDTNGTSSDDDFGDTQPAEGQASPSPEQTPFPLLVPDKESESSASPRATPTPKETEPTATPTATPTPQPTTTPTPQSTAGASPSSSDQVRTTERQRTGVARLLEASEPTPIVQPGTIVATPRNGQVRLDWRPPADVKSGFDRLRIQADAWLADHRKIGPITLPANLASLQAQYSDRISQWLQGVAGNVASTIIGSISVVITLVLIPLVTFFVLNDMERLRGRLLFFLPERARIEFVRLASDVGEVFGNYLRGMATVSALYGVVNFVVFLGFGLWFQHGLTSYSLLLGFIAGILYPVPYVGPTTTTLVTGIVALATGHAPWQVITIVVVALLINQVFDNILVPRLVGKSVGLHPLVTLFALLLGGNLFGLWGMLFSVPAAASIQLVLFRLVPRFGAPTPLAYLMPSRKPSDGKEDTAESRSANRDLLKMPTALTDDRPDQNRVSSDATDVTGSAPLGPVPTANTDVDAHAAPPPKDPPTRT